MKILLIEDDARLGPLIARLLTAERHTVQLSATGADGITFWETASWDLVILDRMLPDLEGSSILRDRRHAGDTTPVLMLTALGTVDDRVEGLDSGADDYLTKHIRCHGTVGPRARPWPPRRDVGERRGRARDCARALA